jgi:hypothetical protein
MGRLDRDHGAWIGVGIGLATGITRFRRLHTSPLELNSVQYVYSQLLTFEWGRLGLCGARWLLDYTYLSAYVSTLA